MKSTQAEIIKQDHLVDDIYSMYIKNKELTENAHSGQFVSLYSRACHN